MPIDYRRQYTPEQLEPLWPNGMIRLTVASLVSLAILIAFAVLPVLLDHWGLSHWITESEPADPRATPIHIRPEWYFLAVYQWLKLFPSEFLGIPGKTLGVLSQLILLIAVLFLPFWARRGAQRPAGPIHITCVTAAIIMFVVFTLWATWPPPPLMVVTICAVVVLFYLLIVSEHWRIRRVFYGRRRRRG